jgi:cell division protein FtsI/penicillin-binding protein 2
VARQKTAAQQHLSIIKPRAAMLFVIVAGLYVLLAGRLTYLQAARHVYFQTQVDAYRVRRSLLPAQRGLILDRDGLVLAANVPAAAVYADPQEVADPASAAAQLAPVLHEDPARLQKLLTPRSSHVHYILLKRHIAVPGTLAPPVIVLTAQIKKAGLAGIYVVSDTRRSYPDGSLAATVLGFTNRDGIGVEGLEHSQENVLQGHDGKIVAEIDNDGRFLPGTTRRLVEADNGADIITTLDERIQQVTDTELAKTVTEHHADHGIAIVMDPQTGAILALSEAPSYNPNQPRPLTKLSQAEALQYAARWRDGAVSDLYEPGSTLKTITASAVLQEQGLDMMNVHVYCSPTLQIGKHTIHEAADGLTNHLGSLDLRGILQVSSNVGMAQFGMRLGAPRLYEYEKKFGFLDYPDSGLPGEQKSFLQAPDMPNRFTGSIGWSQIQLANISFGQGISLTPLQLTAAYCAIANGGTLMRPHIIKAIRKNGVETPVAPEVIRRVVSPEVAAAVRSMLGTVVTDGSGKSGQIADFTVGGKTGSAQIAGPHGYEAGHFASSFCGLYPLSHPRLVILCVVFKPQGIFWGATVAAPVVHNIARAAMLQMQVVPDAPGRVDWDDHLRGSQPRSRTASRGPADFSEANVGPEARP